MTVGRAAVQCGEYGIIRRMTLQQLKYADAIAATGSMSEAARQVFVTQPTLTESIRALEKGLRAAFWYNPCIFRLKV